MQYLSGSTQSSQRRVYFDEKTRPIPPYLRIVAAVAEHGDSTSVKRRGSFIPGTSAHRSPETSTNENQSGAQRTSAIASQIGPSALARKQLKQHDQNGYTDSMDSSDLRLSTTSLPEFKTAPKPTWRLRDRMKTVGVGLVMALHVGTDPPDIVKPHPCAKLQCWMDPSSVPRPKAKERIGDRLEAQYARWQLRAAPKYRRALDPTVEEVKALCASLRKHARQGGQEQRILLHYNGHGVPRPTSNGEIWVFNHDHTEYIPLSVTDLRQWVGKPTILVLDCSNAGVLMQFLTTPLPDAPSTPGSEGTPEPREEVPLNAETAASRWVKDTIVLCPTAEGEWLPMHPDFPADIFTSCLTTPIQVALRWFVKCNSHSMGSLKPEAVDSIPGQASDRKTPLGELNWIFTTVTDSIAWDVLPKALFQRLFRQDLLVASMFRNFLLADRILRSMNCTPQSYPPLPPGVADHALWQAWDLACETCLFGLMQDGILGNHVLSVSAGVGPGEDGTPSSPPQSNSSQRHQAARQLMRSQGAQQTNSQPSPPLARNSGTTVLASSISSPFFSEQLTAFEMWLQYAERYKDSKFELESPEQLPVVLQVLLSQVHRIRALELLRRFLELGPWAVNSGLSLGIYPYVMKLLQSAEYKSVLVNIWACILKFDPSCQIDLVKDGVLPPFIQPFANWQSHSTTSGAAEAGNSKSPPNNQPSTPTEAAKQRTFATFVLAATCHRYPKAQTECLRHSLHVHCGSLLANFDNLREQYLGKQQRHLQSRGRQSFNSSYTPAPEPSHTQLLTPTARMWLCLCLGNFVQKCPPVQREAYRTNVHTCLTSRLEDEDPHVRASAAYALGCLLEKHDVPTTPSNMSLGPTLATTKGLPQTSFQPGQQAVARQHVTSAALTASAVLSAPLQQPIGQQRPLGNPTIGQNPAWPSHQGAPSQAQMGQLQLGTHMQPLQLPPQMQPQQQQPGLQPQQMPLGAQLGRPQQVPPLQQMSSQQSMVVPNPQGLRVAGQPLPATAPILQQDSLLRTQGGGAALGGQQRITTNLRGNLAGGSPASALIASQGLARAPMMPVANTAAGLLAPGLSHPDQIHQAQQLRRNPTVYEDLQRLELEMSVAKPLMEALTDGSSVVRHEAVMALSCFVEKYIQAFLVVAEESMVGSADSEKWPRPGSGASEETKRGSGTPPKVNRVVEMPKGLTQESLHRFVPCWQALRDIQHSDPHPTVAEVANSLVSVVHEQLLDIKMEKEKATSAQEPDSGGLDGATEEHVAYQAHGNKEATLNKLAEDGKTRQPPVPKHLLRRTVSDRVGDHDSSTESTTTSLFHSPQTAPTLPDGGGERTKKEYVLPRSSFYEWKKDSFKFNFDDSDGDDLEDRDPLNPSGAARSYQQRRNGLVHQMGRKLANHFGDLRPKEPRKVNPMLESDDDSVENDLDLKKELKLRETKVLQNEAMNMTSFLKFHSYENVLMVGDDRDGISVCDYERGSRLLSYKNGHPKKSRMTSAFWINESSKSVFFAGSDDGSARFWSGIFEDNGEVSKQNPTLASSFFAAPDMEAGKRSSGLICEWQQFSGTLIAGGNSRQIRCWDVLSEKCVASMETGTSACITALTTAWDQQNPLEYNGLGPSVVVAGHGDGSLKLFDMRTTNAVGQFGGRPHRQNRFTEHQSWIVDIAFTTYGGRFEVISGTVAGDIRVWDLRRSSSLRSIDAQRSEMTALAVHKQIPIVATGSNAQFINIMTLDGDALQLIRHHEELSGHRIGPVSCLEFHKQKLVLAAGASNSLVSVYKPMDRPKL